MAVSERERALADLAERVAACERCPRLIKYCRDVAETKRRAYRDETYWGRPVPGFGDPNAQILVIGLAPAAHGANRTGRMFTGDGTDRYGSSEFLTAALHGTGHANRATSRHRGDGLTLSNVFLTSPCRCAPPANKPLPEEFDNCESWLVEELDLFQPRAVVCLGAHSWNRTLELLRRRDVPVPSPRPKFGHGAEADFGADHPRVFASYHPSRQNTATKRLTQRMLRAVLRRAAAVSREE